MDESMIRWVEDLLHHAILKRASDVHIEPQKTHTRIRFRCDGLLEDIATLPHPEIERINARLKIMAQMDIAEKRLPQDGRVSFSSIDIRLSTCPTIYGEKMVLRLLPLSNKACDLQQLGLSNPQLKKCLLALEKPHGLILVTGPTGSGKTMTLYAMLQYLNQSKKNIATAEDPVEKVIPGINQVNIHPKVGLHFSTLLRSLLRQDPDVLMIGEIRDLETAIMACQAAETGHLVLSTLHTHHANDAAKRLQSIGVPHDQCNQALSLIVSQRLIRKLCEHCKAHTSDGLFFKATGCEKCHKGYLGRTGIFELLFLNETEPITCETLLTAGIEKVKAGLTDAAEIYRVLGVALPNHSHIASN